MSYYNTTHLKGNDLKDSQKKAKSQQELIAEFFANNKGKNFTPFEVQSSCPGLITSVRRAMTDLTDDGILEKTPVQRTGPHGKPGYTWKYKEDQQQLRLF